MRSTRKTSFASAAPAIRRVVSPALVASLTAAMVSLGCGPKIHRLAPAETTELADETQTRALDEAVERGDPVAVPPLATLPALTLTEQAGSAETTLARKQAGHVAVSADGLAFAFYGLGPTWIVTPEQPQGVALKQRVSKARFSADNRRAALLTEDGVIVVSTNDGKVRFTWPRPEIHSWHWEARFAADDSNILLMFDGCSLWRIDTRSGDSSTIGGEVCGEPRASLDGKRWLIVTTANVKREILAKRGLSCPPTCQGIQAMYALDATTGVIREYWRGDEQARVIHGLAAAPDLSWYCASVSAETHRLVCRAFDASEAVTVWEGVTDGRAVFDASGKRLVFGVGAAGTARDIQVADLGARTIQKVGSAGAREEWYAFVSPTRIISTGGEQVFVYDLDGGHKSAIGTPGEWEGFAVIPGDSDRFLVGQDQRGSRDYFWVKLRR